MPTGFTRSSASASRPENAEGRQCSSLTRIAGVAVSEAAFHFDKLYSYKIPPTLADRVLVGSMVLVPFGKGSRPRMGVVLDVSEGEETPRLKELFDAAPEEACLTPDLLELVRFLKERTFCTYYEAVRAIIPYGAQYRPARAEGRPVLEKGLSRYTEAEYRLTGELPEKPRPTEKQKKAVELLAPGPLRLRQLEQNGISRAVIEGLCKKGVVSRLQVDKAPDLYGNIPFTGESIQLTAGQQAAYEELAPCLRDSQAHSALLYGVTGSGKTLVFLKLIEETLRLGRTALVLVPEISLTPQMIRRLKMTFGSRVAVQHSALNNTERLLQWQMIQKGGADIVVGTRSAVFAPLQNLGLIVMDEEQEHTYHSESAPRYSAHQVAARRAADNGALLLFASATPSLERFWAAKQGRCRLVRLTERYSGRPLPSVELVDMRAELAAGNGGEVSLALADQLKQTLAAGKQAILLLNRRGYRTVAQCADCGKSLKCPSCSVPMVYHKAQGRLMCHYCGQILQPPPEKCPECGGLLRYTGYGTQRIEEELARLFPQARILRMDQDTTTHKNAHEEMLARFARHEYDLMLGTQMVAKGLDFEDVTLVGVLGVDAMLNSQSFRAYENAFSLITQVVGRGGRADSPGHALIQTSDPSHPVLALAARQDYDAFFEQEIGFRRLGLYPPFCTLCLAGFSGAQEAQVLGAASRFGQLLAEEAGREGQIPLRVLGPAPMNVAMVNGLYRYKLTIKCRGDKPFRDLMRRVMTRYSEEGLPARASVTLDMNSDGDI